MILGDVETWPAPVLEYLNSEYEMLLADAKFDRERIEAYLNQKGKHIPMALMPSNPYVLARERVWLKTNELLKPYTLRGWHCTRLTEFEVDNIRQNGMHLPNSDTLRERIRRLEADRLIAADIAERLIADNYSNEAIRKHRIWFCFFDLATEDQTAIERLLRRWGGEALYCAHEDDPVTGKVLQQIGRPCLLEANVPIASLGGIGLGDKAIHRYLLHRGFDTREPWEHEDSARTPIAADHILRFVWHGEPEFSTLTGCDTWVPPLA